MADNNGSVTYPILFDLESGVKKAAEDWNNKYADKLEKAIQKRALEIKLKFDTAKLDTLDQVKQRLAQLKIEPMTPETKTAIKDLVRELNALAKAMEKVQKYSNIQTPELQQALANKANAEAAHMAEKYRQANERVEIAKRRVTLAEQKHAEAMFQTAKAGKRQSEVYQEQTTYLNRLLKRMAVYWSVSTIQSFLTNVREVTAQFELQRVSLGAIIQDQNRANALFAEIKSFALKSPVKILDLTKYTKQVAAYGFETEKLFDTTKRLADISVGLGADMSRATLFLGQVYASNYLRAAELRQATELGIPLVDKLAKKLEELNGRAYSAAEVMNLISKRAISYELVEQVFKDMTSAGGEFYNMQERQGNTLYGMWSKLGDAAAMMYDEIGNTSFINSGMKDAIGLLSELMKNWRYFGNTLLIAVPTMLLVHNIEKARAANSVRQIAAMNTLTAATTRRIAAEKALNNAIASGLSNTAAKARMNLILAQTEEKVAQKALTAGNSIGLLGKRFNLLGGTLQKLSAFVATNFWTILLTGVALLTSALVSANEKANRLKNTIAEIGSAGDLEIYQSKENFEKLANAAVKAATGSKKQRDALDELHRTYRDMIPAQDMTLEKLIAMEGKYGKLTIAIEEYIRARLKQQQIEAVTSEIGADLAKAEKKMTEDAKGFYYTYDKGATKLKLNYDQIQLLIKGIKEIAKAERNLPTRKVFAKALTDYVGLDPKGLEVGLDEWLNTFDDGLFAIVRHTREFEAELDRIEANEKLDTTLGKYAEGWKKVNERIDNLTVKGAKVGTFTYDQATINASIIQYKGYLKEVLGNAWDESFASIEEHVGKNGDKMSALFIEKMMAPEYWDKLTVAQQQAILKVKKAYEGLIPTDRTVNILREKLQDISTLYGMSMDVAKQFRMNAGETIEDYAKRVKSSLEDAQNSLKELKFNKSQMDAGVGVGVLKPVSDEELENADTLVKVLTALFQLISGFTKTKSSGTKSDPRLQNLKEEISLTKKLYDEYHKLEKQIGATRAAEKIQQIYSNTIKTLQERAGKYGFTFALPFTDANLKANMQHFIDKMKELQKLKDKKGKPLFPNIGKEIDEAVAQLEDVDLNSLQKTLERKLKTLADRISRSKAAREFYEKILKSTRDVNLAENMTLSVFGIDGSGLAQQTADQVRTLAKSVGKELPKGVINLDEAINPTKLREWAEELAKIEGATDVADKLKKIADDEEKTDSKRHDRWAKDLEKAKEYADKRIELAQYTADNIAEIEAKQRMLDPADASYKAQMAAYDEEIRGYRERERNEAAKLDYEQVKEQIGMFDDLGVRIGSAFEQILTDLRAYTQSPDFARLGLEAQKNVYAQIAKVEERMAEGFQGIGIGTVSEYVREYSTAASEYLTAQRQLKEATLAAIDADKKYNEAKKSGNQAAIDATLAEKQLADSRVASATAAVNAAGAKLQRTQSNAARASERFNSNLQKVESSLQSLNGGGLRALWDLIGDKGKQSVGEFLSGAASMKKAAEQMSQRLADGSLSIGALSDNITKGLADAMKDVDTSDLAATTEGLKNGLVEGFKASGASEELAKTMTEGMGDAVDATATAITTGVETVAQSTGKLAKTAAEGSEGLVKGVGDAASKTGEMWGAVISLILSLLDEFAENGLGTFLGEIIEGVGDAVEGILANLLTDTVPKIIASVGSLLKGVGQGLGDLLTFGAFDFSYSRRVKKANKEIERQQEILDNLEYQYGRLEKAMESAFGADYISNYNARLRALQAQQQAYMAQASAERSKGKKADEDKIKEYEQSARDTADSITEMLSDVSARMFGSDLASTARDFARAWLDAYKEFGNTADAISEKFRDMMESMIVESLLGRVMQQALTPAFSMIDNMAADDFYSEDFWRRVAAAGETAMDQAEAGAQSVMRFLEGAGVSVTATAGELRGISREVATASEESVTGLTAALNTQNHYTSHLPGIAANVAAMRQLLESGGAAIAPSGNAGVDTTALWTRHLELQAGIYDHTLRTARQCEAMAEKCAAMAADIHSVVAVAGTRASRVVNVAVR